MYVPTDAKNPQYPVFARIDGRIVPFLSARCAVALVAAGVIACVLWAASGQILHEDVVAMTPAQTAEARDDLKAQLYAAKLDAAEEALSILADEDGKPREDLDQKDLAAYQDAESERKSCESMLAAYSPAERASLVDRARESGIGAGMDLEGIERMVPTEMEVVEPVLDPLTRFALCVLLPIVGAGALFGEVGGMSIAGFVGDELSFRRRPREHFYIRKEA